LLRATVLGITVASALLLYFSLMFYVFPQSYQSMEPRRPEAIVTNASLSASEITLGQTFAISVTGVNSGEDADMQIISVGFPNLTRTDSIKVLEHDFAQTPILINAGKEIGSGYSGTLMVKAQYASVEASSRPWSSGRSYSIELQVKPEAEGVFAVFVKSVAFPHSWDGAHWPDKGITDHQKEFVQAYYVKVAKP
jgi:hypothetical protein